ncbi:MAG TPA: hypothetical protein DCE11_09300 [Ruminiclostridium sp.]|jgi:small-conductance mechanosensitive channel|nr:hypothetical protein [Clostridiaceae bacterium]HAA26290.1 hypothetical protein [Ruminiclostridium sp.]
MDNKVGSQIKRALRVTGDYFVSLIIFAVFSSIVFGIAKENIEKGIYVFSIIIFLIMFLMIYTNMSDIAFREKRPQYKLNPSPYKGFLYGIIGTIPIFLIQLLYYLADVVLYIPKEFFTIKRRILQAFTGPLYWLAKIISYNTWAYHVVLLVIPVIAGLGYLAGHYEFYIMKKLKIFNKIKRKNEGKRKK